jgi:DNA-binding MarR family transcriptional regulator
MDKVAKTDPARRYSLKRASYWIIWKIGVGFLIYAGLFLAKPGAWNLLRFYVVLVSIVALINFLVKSMREETRQKGRSVPAWMNALADFSIVLILAYFGHFFYATAYFIAQGAWAACHHEDKKANVFSDAQKLILSMLSEVNESYGRDLIEASAGALHPGSIYGHLRELREAGFVGYEDDQPLTPGTEIARRRYWITDKGREILQQQAEVSA